MKRLERDAFRKLDPNSDEYWLWWHNAVSAMVRTYYKKRGIAKTKEEMEDEVEDTFVFIMEVVDYSNKHGAEIKDPFGLIATYAKTPMLNTKKQWREKNELSTGLIEEETKLQPECYRRSCEESDWWERPCEDNLSVR